MLAVLGAAPTARHFVEVLDLVAIVADDHVAYVVIAAVAATKVRIAETLQRGVVRLYVLVVGYTSGVHSAVLSVGRVPGWVAAPPGPFTFRCLHSTAVV
jgi:hypothetical protein